LLIGVGKRPIGPTVDDGKLLRFRSRLKAKSETTSNVQVYCFTVLVIRRYVIEKQ